MSEESSEFDEQLQQNKMAKTLMDCVMCNGYDKECKCYFSNIDIELCWWWDYGSRHIHQILDADRFERKIISEYIEEPKHI